MIEPSLPAACYTQNEWFVREQKEIFKKLWIFAGLTQQLQSENSFIARDFSGLSVLIQRTGGRIRAFKNACAHRGMPLQTAEFGNRKLICQYHGWTYADDGTLRGIPNAEIYGFCNQKKESIRLHAYPVEIIGNFVFICLSENPPSIEHQFSGHLIDLLREVSPYFAPEVSYTHFTNSYNWKLNFENVLDWNHAQFVHRQTLAPLLQFENTGEFTVASSNRSRLFVDGSPLANIRFSGDAPIGGVIDLRDISRIGRSAMPYQERWFSKNLGPPCDIGAFFACNIFPNVNFGSIHGENFYLQQYVPMAPDRIEYHSWVFTTRLKPDMPSQPHLLWGIHHAEKRVIDEDTVLLTALQKSLASLESIGPMGDHEAPLAAMGQWYMQHLQNTRQR